MPTLSGCVKSAIETSAFGNLNPVRLYCFSSKCEINGLFGCRLNQLLVREMKGENALPLLPDMSASENEIFCGCQVLDAHWPSCVQLLCADPDLSS